MYGFIFYMYTNVHSYICLFIHILVSIQYRSSQILPETGSPVSTKDHHVQSWEIPGEKGPSCSCHASTAPLPSGELTVGY